MSREIRSISRDVFRKKNRPGCLENPDRSAKLKVYGVDFVHEVVEHVLGSPLGP